MMTADQISEVLKAPCVSQELADRVGVKIGQLYRIRRRARDAGVCPIVDRRHKSDAARINRYVIGHGDCWNWTGSIAPGGYGRLGLFRGEVQAHRASYIYHIGPIPDGLCVLHSCDNRRCINPSHLRVGTHTDNQRDAYDRKRRPIFRGASNANAKLTEAQAMAILNDTRKLDEVAADYQISTSLVSAIRVGTAWRHLARTTAATQRAQMNLR